MRTYKVTGYCRVTGEKRTVEVAASTHKEARKLASVELTYPTLGTDKVRAFLSRGPKPKDMEES